MRIHVYIQQLKDYTHRKEGHCILSHRRQSWELGVATHGLWGGESWGLHEILLYYIMYRNMRWKHFPRWWLF